VLIYLSKLQDLGAPGIAIAVAYALCGVLRLARYNVDTSEIGQQTFQGCPIPIAAGYLMAFVMVRNELPAWLVGAGVVGMAVAMISKLKIPKFRKGNLPFWMLGIGIVNFAVFLYKPCAITWHIWNTWNLIMVAANYVMLWRRGVLSRRQPEAELERAA